MKTVPPEKSKELTTLTSASYEDLVREMIVRLGEDPSREGLAATPQRFTLDNLEKAHAVHYHKNLVDIISMVKHAAQLGANAIIGVRYDANEIATGVTEVLAYGTAVQVEVFRR